MTLKQLITGNDVENIARKILGTTISSNIDGFKTSGIIVETEAYKAPEDKGSHAFENRRTKRTEVLFGQAGTAYVYLCYGLHHLTNIVTGPVNTAHAILIRAIEPLEGVEIMMKRRKVKDLSHNLTNGPGKLSQALGISIELNNYNFMDGDPTLSLDWAGNSLSEKEIISSPRVGIAYAGECAKWPWRFRIGNNPWTSLPHNVTYE